MKVLIVEDDATINNLLKDILLSTEFTPVQAFSGTEAGMVLEMQQISLVILDLMLPGLTGEELLPLIKSKGNIPVLILSTQNSPHKKAALLRSGADDYLEKPFDDEELLARIEVLLRRMRSIPVEKFLRYKDIVLDQEARTVRKAESWLVLTAREFDILELLMSNPRKVFTKSNLYHSIWKDEFLGDDNTVNVHISNLRSKLGEGDYIQTVWGIGFKLNDV